MTPTLVFLTALLAHAPMPLTGSDHSKDFTELTDGVGPIIAPRSVPGNVAALGKDSFVVITGKGSVPIFVAEELGKGRVLAGGHGGFFANRAMENAGNAKFFANAIRWLAKGKTPNIGASDASVSEAVLTLSLKSTHLDRQDLEGSLEGYDVLCVSPGELDNDPKAQRNVLEFVKRGHGLLIAGPGWGWGSLNPGKDVLSEHPGNRMLREYGVAFGSDTVSGPFVVPGIFTPSAEAAIESLKKPDLTLNEKQADLASIQSALGVIPAVPNRFEKKLIDGISDLAKRESGGVTDAPTEKAPITSKMPFARLQAELDFRTMRGPAELVKAHPWAKQFPGEVPADAPLVSDQVAVDTTVPGWHATGLYAKPGVPIEISVADRGPRVPLRIRIGAHTDNLWSQSSWARFPEITLEKPITGPVTKVASAFGGLIYVDVPKALPKEPMQGLTFNFVTIKNAVKAVHYLRGITTASEWAEMRKAPAPWADLQGKYVALIVPASVVRSLGDPEPLMAYWDEMMELIYGFYAAPYRIRPERYCTDVQISAGYMHSGYPIMTHLDVAAHFVDVDFLRSPKGSTWGFYHEMGHNFQQSAWTWDGCGEVTNNLFSLYGSEKLNAADYHDYGSHSAVSAKAIHDRVIKYVAAGSPYEKWKSDPFLALTMYVQLRQSFGWEPFTKLFGEYRTLPAGEQPRSDLEKRDQWMVRFSRTIGKNLGPFFQAWGVPTSDAARDSIKDLPVWMPADWPKELVRS